MSTLYTSDEQRTLLHIARESIAHGLRLGRASNVAACEYSPALREIRATFVTLELDRQLRGCIGMLDAVRTLVDDVAGNGYAAAFHDPRFPPVTSREHQRLSIHISVLTPSVAMQFESEADLIRQLRPGVDGLILEESARYRGTFLPSVWESLPHPKEFLRRLKQKAGLPENYWSETIRVKRYTTQSIK